jgi:hypothetical protein
VAYEWSYLASERIALPEIIGLGGFEHITPSETAPALLPGSQARGRLASILK